MMGGFGSISGMISSLKFNRNQLKNIERDPLMKTAETRKNKKPLQFASSMSDEELSEFKSKLEQKRKRHLMFTVFIYSSVFIAALLIAFWILF